MAVWIVYKLVTSTLTSIYVKIEFWFKSQKRSTSNLSFFEFVFASIFTTHHLPLSFILSLFSSCFSFSLLLLTIFFLLLTYFLLQLYRKDTEPSCHSFKYISLTLAKLAYFYEQGLKKLLHSTLCTNLTFLYPTLVTCSFKSLIQLYPFLSFIYFINWEYSLIFVHISSFFLYFLLFSFICCLSFSFFLLLISFFFLFPFFFLLSISFFLSFRSAIAIRALSSSLAWNILVLGTKHFLSVVSY